MNRSLELRPRSARRAVSTALALISCAILLIACSQAPANPAQSGATSAPVSAPQSYLGFDRNIYPGTDLLPELRKTFSFTGYWLTPPPGEHTNTWIGEREKLQDAGFGFLVLANGRLARELVSIPRAAQIGKRDASLAVAAARREGFPPGTIIFLDQEQGGKLLPIQLAYLFAWLDEVTSLGFKTGVYCSGIPTQQPDNSMVVTAKDIQEHAGSREISYWVYEDFCPPAPGCVYPPQPLSPDGSGTKFATVWQYAESPREKDRTSRCAATYDRDDNCYAPNMKAAGLYVDLNVATSADPSHARH